MKLVRVKGIGVQVKGISYFKNDTFNVTEDDYEPIKELVEVLEEDKLQEDTRSVVIKVEDESIDLKEVEKYLYECLNNFGKVQEDPENPENPEEDPENPENPESPEDSDGEDEELEALKDRAKELDIKVTANMKKETIIKKIEEAEKAKEEQSQNPDGE